MGDRVSEAIAIIRRHQDVTDVFRLMKDRLGLTNEFCDDVGGLTKGHTDKILGPSQSKTWGPTTFDLFCEMFAIEFHVHVDLAAAQRMADVWEKRKRPVFENAKVGRVSKKLIEAAKPLVAKAMGKAGAKKRASKLSAKLRSKIARKGGKKRMRKITKAERSAMMRKGWETRRQRQAIAVAQALDATALQSPPADSPQPECPATSAE